MGSPDKPMAVAEYFGVVGIEGRSVITRISPLDLVDDIGREDMRLFNGPDRGLGCVGLAVVVGDWTYVAARGGLTHGHRAGLATHRTEYRERVVRIDCIVDAGSC